MIYVDMKIFSMRKTIDLKLDETISVNELLKEVTNVFSIGSTEKRLISVNQKRVLAANGNLLEQGVKGGDTLILVECE